MKQSGEMAQQIKGLKCKHEDPSLDPQKPCKARRSNVRSDTPALPRRWGIERRESQKFLVSQSVYTIVKKKRLYFKQGGKLGLAVEMAFRLLWACCGMNMFVLTCTYTYKHADTQVIEIIPQQPLTCGKQHTTPIFFILFVCVPSKWTTQKTVICIHQRSEIMNLYFV